MAVYRDINEVSVTNDLIDIDSIKRSILNIVFTDSGTIPGLPEFGCGVSHSLFEQMDDFSMSTLKTVIQNAIQKWEQRVRNIEVTINPFPEFNRIVVDISFTVNQLNTQDNITFKLS